MNKGIIAIFCLLTLLGSCAIFWLYYKPSQDELKQARLEYDDMVENLEVVMDGQQHLQQRLTSLQTQVDFVELDARRQYRLIRPGEHIAMIDSN